MAKTLQENLVSAGVDKAVVFSDYIRDKGRSISGSNLYMTQEAINAEVQNTLSQKADASNTYTKNQVDSLIGDISTLEFKIVSQLPAEGDSGTIYLLNTRKMLQWTTATPFVWENSGSAGNANAVSVESLFNAAQYGGNTELYIVLNSEGSRPTVYDMQTINNNYSLVAECANSSTHTFFVLNHLNEDGEWTIARNEIKDIHFIPDDGKLYLHIKPNVNGVVEISILQTIPQSVNDSYDEYVWVKSDNKFELIGTTNIDLSNYATLDEIPKQTSELVNDSHFAVDASYVHTDNNFSNDYKDAIDILAYTFSTSVSPSSDTVYSGSEGTSVTATMTKTSKVTGNKVEIQTPTINNVTPTNSNNTYTNTFSNVSSTTTYTFKEGSRTVGTATYTRTVVEHILYGTTTSTNPSTSLLSGATVYNGSATTTSKGRAYTVTGLNSTFYFFIAVPNSNSGLTNITLPEKVNIGSTYDALAASDLVDMTSGTTFTYNNIKYKVYRSPALAADTATKSYYIS